MFPTAQLPLQGTHFVSVHAPFGHELVVLCPVIERLYVSNDITPLRGKEMHLVVPNINSFGPNWPAETCR